MLNPIKFPFLSKESTASVSLDLLRGLAAILVMISHLRSLFLVDYQNVLKPNIATNILYFVTGLGHQSVIIFFVLSGYLIASNVLRSINNGTWRWQTYLINRLSRLFIVLLPAIVLGTFWDQLGIKLFYTTGLYNGTLPEHVLNFSVLERSNALTALGNIFFLQGIVVQTFGSNGALWSLAYEFWYYILFPMITLVFAYALRKQVEKVLLYCIFSVVIMVFVGKVIVFYFLVWLLGTLVYVLPKMNLKRNYLKNIYQIGAITILVITLLMSRLNPNTDMVSLLIALAVSFLIYTLLSFYQNRKCKLRVKRLAFISRFSYTLYLIHTPILVFAYGFAIKLGFSKWQPHLVPIFLSVLIALFVIVYAWVVSLITEEKTENVRNILLKWFMNIDAPNQTQNSNLR